MTKQLRYITSAFLTLLLLHSCQEEIALDESNQISFTTSVQDQTSISRATIFENQNDILDYAADGKGGGNLTMHAYKTNTGEQRIRGSRAWYFNKVWRFFDASSNKFYNHYWPNERMDFFAYMPWNGSGRLKNIEVDKYEVGTGLTIKCKMQSTTADQNINTDDLLDPLGQETIIAYTPDKHKETVNLHFVHPFAAVSFELKQAHRNLTINWIRFNNLYLTGTTTLNAPTESNAQISWTGTDEPDDPVDPVDHKTFTIPVGKTIPTDINFGAKIGGPYLVMPQDLAGSTITINYTWDNAKADDDVVSGDENTDTKDHIYQITRHLSGNWLAGNKYTYVLNLGDNEAEILFKVLVEPWQVTGGNNNIFDVE